METKTLIKSSEKTPAVFDKFFVPWKEWPDDDFPFSKIMKMPSVNISTQKDKYEVSLAAPGFKKEDFKIDIDDGVLTIFGEKEENKDEKDKKYARKEYSYASFSRSFTLPDEVLRDKAEAKYEDGILKISLPRQAKTGNGKAKQVSVK